jgi:hypothetical protein
MDCVSFSAAEERPCPVRWLLPFPISIHALESPALEAMARERRPSILKAKGLAMFAPLRFLWNATRGHRLTPWRSEYFRWRVETYSGKPAETLTFTDIVSFVWTSRWELLSYLAWIGRLDREVRKTGNRE